ncbi:MAG TPA: DUF2306 domain-containing protein [Allosphingosinicella sp.]|nr:DUF2306 domain-containing protein [Allosphingosinicella sp.]
MNILMAIHIAAGLLAIPTGTVAAAAGKGGRLHARAGTLFLGSMLVLGISGASLEPFRTPEPGSPLVGVFVCYFVLTGWMAARRRDGRTGWFEIAACAVALGLGALTAWGGFTGTVPAPDGVGPMYVAAGLCMLGGVGDLRAALLKRLTPPQRIARHLWRMSFAFFIATGSFFLGQQDVLPAAVRGSPFLFVLALAPLALMAFWLIRVRLGKRLRAALQALPERKMA